MDLIAFHTILCEKLKSMGYHYKHDVTEDTDYLRNIEKMLKKQRRRTPRVVFEKDLRRNIMKDHIGDIMSIINFYGMESYQAEMIDVILGRTMSHFMKSGLISKSDKVHNQHYPNRSFILTGV